MRVLVSFLLLCSWLSVVGQTAPTAVAVGDYDRLRTVERFITVLYPRLTKVRGTLTYQTGELNWPDYDFLYFHLQRCNPGSGIRGGLYHSIFGKEPETRPEDFLCPAPMMISGTQHYLDGQVRTGPKQQPIHWFNAHGEFLSARLREALDELSKHPEWDHERRLGYLEPLKPTYGPSGLSRLKALPSVSAIHEFSGCKLDFSTASFLTGRLEVNNPLYHFGWVVSGTRVLRIGKKHSTEFCQATFEPFDGDLTSLN